MLIEQLQRQLKHMALEVTPYPKEHWPKWREGEPPDFTLKASFEPNWGYNTAWPPTEEQLLRLKQYNHELGAKHFLEGQYPDLLIQIHIYPETWSGAPDVAVWIKRRAQNKWVKGGWGWQDQGAETLGSYPLSRGIRKVLAGLERVAWNAKGPGMFLCTSCRRAQPVEDREAVVFAAHYCKSCYRNDPRIKREVDDSRKPGFYE